MKNAHWIQRTHLFKADEYICSACNAVYGKPRKECPSCGTHMRKTKYDATWVDEAECMSAVFDDDW